MAKRGKSVASPVAWIWLGWLLVGEEAEANFLVMKGRSSSSITPGSNYWTVELHHEISALSPRKAFYLLRTRLAVVDRALLWEEKERNPCAANPRSSFYHLARIWSSP